VWREVQYGGKCHGIIASGATVESAMQVVARQIVARMIERGFTVRT
jgi:hypothetical protein